MAGASKWGILLVIGFILPGLISLWALSLMQPGDERLRPNVYTALVLGAWNFLIVTTLGTLPVVHGLAIGKLFMPVSWGCLLLEEQSGCLVTAMRGQAATILARLWLDLVLFPILWAVLARKIYLVLVARGRLDPLRSPFDEAILKRIAVGNPFIVVAHLQDGARIAGFFGRNSRAGLHRHSGDLYLEEAWNLSADGTLHGPVSGSGGIFLPARGYLALEMIEVAYELDLDAASGTEDSPASRNGKEGSEESV
ncbi:MAG: hypothetical protein D6740_00040 [Alphaproteobacteria bacterium]|nr:MAG: hypothetical protein D6740_00040 [Alphaproteobacteria bacterium]